MQILIEDNMSISPDALDFAIEDFYTFPSKENAENLARIAQEYNDNEMIGDSETQGILKYVSEYLTTAT